MTAAEAVEVSQWDRGIYGKLLSIFACSELGRCSEIEERSKSWLVFMCTAPQAACAPHIYANANGSIRRLGDIETLGLVLSCSLSLGSGGTLDLGCILGLVRS